MNLTLEEELIILDKYMLTPNELLVLQSILLLQYEHQEKLFFDLINVFKRVSLSLRDILVSLQKKQIILQAYKIPCEGCPFDPYDIQINKNVTKNLFKASFIIGKELFDNYPQFANIQGSLVGLRSVSKKFDSLEDAYFRYGKAINFNPETHAHIIELVNWAKEHNIINFSLASFIIDRKWNDLEALKNGDGINVNYNTIKML